MVGVYKNLHYWPSAEILSLFLIFLQHFAIGYNYMTFLLNKNFM